MLHVVIRLEAPLTRVHIRGAGLPRMFASVPREQLAALVALAVEVKQFGARLMLDQGGLVVWYAQFAPDDP